MSLFDAGGTATIRLGALYRCLIPGQAYLRTYRVTGFHTNARSGQEEVSYVGRNGPDKGQHLTCSLANFATHFEARPPKAGARDEEAPAEAPVPEKPIIHKSDPGY